MNEAPPLLSQTARLSEGKLLNPERMRSVFAAAIDRPVLIVLAAGKGTRFGTEPKCVQRVGGKPLARHSIDAFLRHCGGPVVCLVHYRQDDVMAALGDDLVYVHSDDPTGGTAFAAYEGFSVPFLRERNPLLFLSMGDRIVPETVFADMKALHGVDGGDGPRLTLLAARYEPPRHVGKGHLERDAHGRITRIVEQRDIDACPDEQRKRALHHTTEANCPLYLVRAQPLHASLANLTNDNAQGQYYLTDVVETIAAQLRELLHATQRERQGFDPELPVAVGVSGRRLRIAFMHPDMGRFFGPAWQMPIGAADADGREQIVILVQEAVDGAIHLFPTDAEFQERLNALPADDESMYPGEDVRDWYAFEGFGTRMAERILLSLGYFSQQEIDRRRSEGLPLPPPQLWVANGMRRPFSLIGNAIASVRTLRDGALGAKATTSRCTSTPGRSPCRRCKTSSDAPSTTASASPRNQSSSDPTPAAAPPA